MTRPRIAHNAAMAALSRESGAPDQRSGSYVIPGPSATDGTAGYLIDWITLRISVDSLGPLLQERLFAAVDTVACFSPGLGALKWEQRRFNFDELRSDAVGLFLTVKHIGSKFWLYLGASPASLIHGCNVFGSMDVRDGAETLLARAMVALQAHLPDVEDWECQRLDVTANFGLPDSAAVKLALKQLLGSDTCRRRASSAKKGGDTVMWAPESDLIAGKAYHKGPHLEHLARHGKLFVTPEQLSLAGRLLRLEMRLGARWFRRLREGSRHLSIARRARHWLSLTASELEGVFREFFGPMVGWCEVTGMERVSLLERIESANLLSQSAARSVLGTYRAIKAEGYEATLASMSRRTFYRHKRALLNAGMSESELVAGNVFQFRPVRIVLAQPVASWEELRRSA